MAEAIVEYHMVEVNSDMNPSLDVREVFLEPEKAEAALKAGITIILIDDDGKAVARVTPEPPVAAKQKKPTAKKKLARGKKSKRTL